MIGPSEDKDKRTRTVSSLSADLVEGTMDDYSLYSEEDEVNFVIFPAVFADIINICEHQCSICTYIV